MLFEQLTVLSHLSNDVLITFYISIRKIMSESVRDRERERERDFYVSGKTCLPFHGHKTAIRS